GERGRVVGVGSGCYPRVSPEGCAASVWKHGEMTPEAAGRLKITAPNLRELGPVDAIVEEPPGGAHQDHDTAARLLDRAVYEALVSLDGLSPEELREDRYQRFRRLGSFVA